MNSDNLSNLLKQLILEHDIVSLPGMGYFEMRESPSELINNGKSITPPSRKIVFESSTEYHDTLLSDAYAKEFGLSAKDASNEISELLRLMKNELTNSGKMVIPEFGTLCFGDSGSFIFDPVPEFDFEADSYCLETLSLKCKNECESVKSVEEEEIVELNPIDIQEVEEKPEMSEPVAEKNKRVPGFIFVILITIGVFILLLIAIFLFKDSLMPLLEKLLYSKEELEILQKVGL